MLRLISIGTVSRKKCLRQFVVATLIVATLSFQKSAAAFSNGESGEGIPAPEFILAGESGTVSLMGLRGKVVYLDFWASWCAPCRQSFPWMVELQKKFKDQGVVVLAVNVDSKHRDAERFLRENTSEGISVLFDPDGRTPLQFSVDSMPSSYVIDRSGRIVRVFHGFRDSEKNQIESAIKEALEN